MNLTANLHPVPRLRMSGAILLLPLCASMDKENFTYVGVYIYIYMCVCVCIYIYIYMYITRAYTSVSFLCS